MTNWQTDIIPKWLEEAKTYPTKALLYMAGGNRGSHVVRRVRLYSTE